MTAKFYLFCQISLLRHLNKKIMGRPLIIILLLIGFHHAAAQFTRSKETLLQTIEDPRSDTAMANAYYELAFHYEMTNQDSALFYLNKLYQISEKANYLKGKYRFYERKTVVSYTLGKFDQAMNESREGLKLARKLGDTSLVIVSLNNMAIISDFAGNFKDQLQYILQVKERIEQTNDTAKFSGLYHNLANVYMNLNNFRKAADYLRYSIHLYQNEGRRNDYINRVYGSLGQAYDGLNMPDSAVYFYLISIEESIKRKDKYAEGALYTYLADNYANQGKFDKMMEVAEKSIQLAPQLQSSQITSTALRNAGTAYFYTGNNAKAREFAANALQLSVKDALRSEMQDAYYLLSYIEAADGNLLTSALFRKKADSIRSASFNEEILKNTAEFEKKFEAEKKEARIQLQEAEIHQKNILNYFLIAGAAALIVISLLSYRNYRNKQKLQQARIDELETEKQLTATEAVLKGEEQERTRLAKDLHDGLGGMLSGIKYSFQTMKGNLIMTPENQLAFERSMDMLDSSIKEMRRVAHNMMPEALVKFGLDTALKDFCQSINQSGVLTIHYQSIGMENTLDQTTAITLYRIVQELISNTIKHASASSAIVQVSKSNNTIHATVEDNGTGFDTKIINREAGGIGWKNIQSRLSYLKGKADISSEKGKGTSVVIEIQVP